MNPPGKQRRHVIKLLSVVTAGMASGIPLLTACTRNTLRYPFSALETDQLMKVGREYLKIAGKDEKMNEISDLLEKEEADTVQLEKTFREWVREDFEEGRLVNLFGWNVSKTEGRLFAAASELLSESPEKMRG